MLSTENSIPQLETVTAKDLLTKPIEPVSFTIDNILPHGLFILSGSSKIGKSWLALDISNCVSNGSNFWSCPTAQGDVLYLALEDTVKRSQERVNKLAPICDIDSPADIHFVYKVQKLGGGLAEQINSFLDEHPQTKLIVIDTLQYIRNTGKFTGTYSGDYHDIDALRSIIGDRKLSMLLITHNHKSDEVDPVNRVIGSAGLTGAVDGIFVLEKSKRIGNMAKLTIANRDTESYQFEIRFDKTNCRWQFVAETGVEDNADDYLCDLLNFLLDETPRWSGTATQLSSALTVIDTAYSISPIALSKLLKSRQEYLRQQYSIECIFTRSKSARFIELCRGVIVVDYENAENPLLGLAG